MSSSDPHDETARQDTAAGGSPPQAGSAAPPSTPGDRLRDQAGRPSMLSNDDDDDHEHELWSGGYSSKAMVGTWILIAIVSVLLLILPAFIDAITYLIAAGIVLLIWVVGGLVYAYRRLSVQYQLTNQRFIHQTGLLSRRTDRIEVIDIDDVTCTQGPVQRLFGVGTIVLTGSDRTHPTLSMIGIAGVRDVASLIDDTRRRERRRRSLHIEAI